MVEELVARVLCTRNCAQLTHWSTRSYAEHMALGDFYIQVVEVIDNFVECYQGNFGAIKRVKLTGSSESILDCLEADSIWIAKNCDAITGDVEPLENILQELTALYLRTIYKLKFLK